jgi:hypothetical protein
MDHHTSHELPRKTTRGKWVLVGFLIVAAYFLWTEHRAHTLSVLPYLLLLACPLMHLFHHGHGHGHDSHSAPSGRQTSQRDGDAS